MARRFALLALMLLLAAPCEARRFYITVAEFGMDSTCTVPNTTRVPTIGGYAVLYWQAWGDSAWHYAGDARCDTLSGRFVSIDWAPSQPGTFRFYAETVSDEMIAGCRRDTMEWVAIDPLPPPPPRFWRPGQH